MCITSISNGFRHSRNLLFHLDLICSTEVSVSSQYSKILITIPDINIFVKLYFILILIKLLIFLLERYENIYRIKWSPRSDLNR